MFIIQDKLVSDDVLGTYFACALDACKGACCWEGDFGAPLESEEIDQLQACIDILKPLLTEEGRQVIESEGVYTYYKEEKTPGTPLLANGACAYLGYDETGIGYCTIEKAFEDGHSPYQKPISCHLYPIRVKTDKNTGFEALNYDQWEICSPACRKGVQTQVKLVTFARQALIRKYGSAFYEELQQAAEAYFPE